MKFRSLWFTSLCLAVTLVARAQLTPGQQTQIDHCIQMVETWAADPVIVQAVVEQNHHLDEAAAALTNDAWKALTLLSPAVRAVAKNPAALALKGHAADWTSEVFLNDAEGRKVAFLAKTTSWSHATSAKHTQPMAGHTWQGPVEVDSSSGLQQVQVAVPVLAEGKVVGSLVVGVRFASL